MRARRIAPRILVSTDFSREGERAFYHALAIAVAREARLTILHAGAEGRDDVPWERFPSVRETLAAWGILPDNAPRETVLQLLNLYVVKMAVRDGGPRRGVAEYLRRRPTDLLVMPAEGRNGLARLLRPSKAEAVASFTRSHALMLPRYGLDLVDPETGRTRVSSVLDARLHGDLSPVFNYLDAWLPALGASDCQARLLHLGAAAEAAQPRLPRGTGRHWQYASASGDDTGSIVDAAREMDVDLVVMSLPGPSGPLARLRGTCMDRVLHELRVPLLAMPALFTQSSEAPGSTDELGSRDTAA
jgi:nucleotide-binding universal stress UspA family protein